MSKKHLPPLIIALAAILSLIAGAISRLFIFQAIFAAAFLIWLDLELILLFLSKRRPLFASGAAIISLVILLAGVSFISVGIKISTVPAESPSKKADCVVLLGTKASHDRSSGGILLSRVRTAAEYLQSHSGIPVIVCGGKSDENLPDEASVMKKELEKLGVDRSRIIVEDRSLSTEENLINAKAISKKLFPQKDPVLLIVTSDFHLYRSSLYAEKLGLDFSLIGASADISPFARLNCLTREYAAVIRFYLSC